MAVCEATNCKKRELCMRYVGNYFKYNRTYNWEQSIDWSKYGSGAYGIDKNGNTVVNRTYDCGDNSITYPLFSPIEIENKENIIESLRYIGAQLEDGYIDLGMHDKEELKIVKQAIEEYKVNHGLINN